jgi:hypothetical protein
MKCTMICLLAMGFAGGKAAAAESTMPQGWQAAPAAVAVPEQGAETAGPSLEEIAAAAKAPPAALPRKTLPSVVPRESYPLPYRTILLRYFD